MHGAVWTASEFRTSVIIPDGVCDNVNTHGFIRVEGKFYRQRDVPQAFWLKGW
jgi:hypothetical protein